MVVTNFFIVRNCNLKKMEIRKGAVIFGLGVILGLGGGYFISEYLQKPEPEPNFRIVATQSEKEGFVNFNYYCDGCSIAGHQANVAELYGLEDSLACKPDFLLNFTQDLCKTICNFERLIISNPNLSFSEMVLEVNYEEE